MINHNKGRLEGRQIAIFTTYCLLTVVSGILSFLRHEPRYISESLAFIAAAIGGTIITFGSLRSLFEKELTVDLLASIAIIGSMISGEYLAAAIIVVMLNGGELIEDYTSRKSYQAVEKLIRSAPVTARVRRDEKEVEIPIEEVKVGDLILVKPGEKIPIDGVVINGYGSVNQASITGESMAIEKTVGNEVYGNTLLEDGALEIRVTKAEKETVFFHITRMVEEAQANKAPVERVANKYARWFTPIIFAIAVITQLLTKDIMATAAVLVVSCPCALLLATPMAVLASIGNAAKNGILVRGGPNLEEVGKSDMVIVDKTGTLTKGSPTIVEVKGFNGRSEEEVIELAAIAEKFSEHAIAKVILQKAEKLGLTIKDPDTFEVRIGKGVVVSHDNKRLIVGNRKLLEETAIVLDENLTDYLTNQEIRGKTPIIVAVDSEPAGVISVSDTLREDVNSSIKMMRKNGIKKVVMLTGDNRHIAEIISKQASIDETHAELLPEKKVEYIKAYQRQGHKVVMIGDGINDAPALTVADVGIAMGISGTDVTIETAGIVLTTDDLSKVAKVIDLGRHTINVIKQNILFSLAVNFIGILLSTQGVISPIAASMIHEGNALIVVFNSLRLINRKL